MTLKGIEFLIVPNAEPLWAFDPPRVFGLNSIYTDTGGVDRHSCIALDGMRVVGVLGYQRRYNHILSLGTFVAKSYRRRQLGFHLWKEVLARVKVKQVRLDIISTNGERLLKALMRAYPNVKWCNTDGILQNYRFCGRTTTPRSK